MMHRLALVVVLVLMHTACGGGSGDDEAALNPAEGSPVGVTAEIEGETLDGERLSLAALRGKPIFVNVWASW